MRSWWPAGVDVAVIVVFALIGRASHAEALDVGGVATTAWPFVVGGLVGSVAAGTALAARPWWVRALAVWAGAALLGMGLRVAAGGTTAVGFVVVASVSLFVLLVGWRAVAHLAGRQTR